MHNVVNLLKLLKWYTDDDHPLTQEALRKVTNDASCIGNKNTFKRRLFAIADAYNSIIKTETNDLQDGKKVKTQTKELKPQKDWKIVFPGYEIRNREPDKEQSDYYTGHIHYHHELSEDEIFYIIGQIHGISLEQKMDLASRLIKETGTKYIADKLASISQSVYCDFPSSIARAAFSNGDIENSDILYSNLSIIRDAIERECMIEFYPSSTNKDGHLCPDITKCTSLGKKIDKYLVSPYRIVYDGGYYWLIGNRRLGTYIDRQSGHPRYDYSKTLDIYRIDKLLDLNIARRDLVLRSKTSFWNTDLNKCIKLLATKINVYKEDTCIPGIEINDTYGKIEFEILWENFPNKNFKDYSFIYDSFGSSVSIKQEPSKTTVCVYAAKDFFIDWALSNINKIKILDNNDIKSEICQILTTGLNNNVPEEE